MQMTFSDPSLSSCLLIILIFRPKTRQVYRGTNFGWDGAGELITQMSVSLIKDDMDMINKCPRVLENLSYRWATDS